MSNMNEASSSSKSGAAKTTRAQKAIRLLMSLNGDRRNQKLKEFEEYYPAALHAKNNRVPRKTILKHISDGGLKLYPQLYEEFMSIMAKAYEDRGDSATYDQCGQSIHATTRPESPDDVQQVRDCALAVGASGEGA